MKLSIALCTYNGEKHLPEQLESISRQTCLPDELVVCDDCSTDATLAILESFAKSAHFTTRIFNNGENLGPSRNFAKAISLCQGEWIFLCDQDDRWLPDKIRISSKKLKQMEETFGQNVPLMVHTDAIVADEELQEIYSPLWALQHSFPEKGHQLAKLLNQNLVTGCTAVLNRALCDKALPISEQAVMHDWWLALVAASFGQIGIIPESTIIYRQHGQNDTGAKSWGLTKAMALLLNIILKNNNEVSTRISQATEFLKRFRSDLSPQQQRTISAFIDLPHRSYFVRKYLTIKYGLYYQGLLRNIGNLLLK